MNVWIGRHVKILELDCPGWIQQHLECYSRTVIFGAVVRYGVPLNDELGAATLVGITELPLSLVGRVLIMIEVYIATSFWV
jgi:hypothetical protein